MKTQEEYAREIDEIVRRDVESCQSDWSVTADVRWKINVDNTRSIWEAAVTMKLQTFSGIGKIHIVASL